MSEVAETTVSHRTRATEVFSEELALIRDPDLKEFVLKVFDAFGTDTFFTRPASKTSKYHPRISCVDPGGLVLHTRLAVWWAKEWLRALDTNDGTHQGPTPNNDPVIAACILHDLMKEGDPLLASQRSGKTGHKIITASHGHDLARRIIQDMFGGDASQMSAMEKLTVYGVAAHMGIWTSPTSWQPHNISDPAARHVVNLVCMADYAASRRVDDKLAELERHAERLQE